MVSENNTRDISGSKKSLQRRWWKRLRLVRPLEDDGRDTSTTLLQRAQEMLHLGMGGGVECGRLTHGKLGHGKQEVSFRPEMLSTSSPQLGELT